MVLSVSRPWTELILRHGKTVENRSWGTSYRGPVLIHAAKSWDPRAADFADERGVPDLVQLREPGLCPTGIVGLVTLVRICTRQARPVSIESCDCGPWAVPGQHHWRLADPRPLLEPIPARGAMGLWAPPEHVLVDLADMGVHFDE
jgi:hypothetical protein